MWLGLPGRRAPGKTILGGGGGKNLQEAEAWESAAAQPRMCRGRGEEASKQALLFRCFGEKQLEKRPGLQKDQSPEKSTHF